MKPLLGHPYPREEYQAEGHQVIISYGFWQRHFGADPGVLGKTIHLNHAPEQIIAVMPPTGTFFTTPTFGRRTFRITSGPGNATTNFFRWWGDCARASARRRLARNCRRFTGEPRGARGSSHGATRGLKSAIALTPGSGPTPAGIEVGSRNREGRRLRHRHSSAGLVPCHRGQRVALFPPSVKAAVQRAHVQHSVSQ